MTVSKQWSTCQLSNCWALLQPLCLARSRREGRWRWGWREWGRREREREKEREGERESQWKCDIKKGSSADLREGLIRTLRARVKHVSRYHAQGWREPRHLYTNSRKSLFKDCSCGYQHSMAHPAATHSNRAAVRILRTNKRSSIQTHIVDPSSWQRAGAQRKVCGKWEGMLMAPALPN